MPCFRREEVSLGNLCYGFEFCVVADGNTSSLMMRRSPCIGSAVVLATVSSSNQVGRKDLTPISVLEWRDLISSRRRLWYTGGTIHAGINAFM